MVGTRGWFLVIAGSVEAWRMFDASLSPAWLCCALILVGPRPVFSVGILGALQIDVRSRVEDQNARVATNISTAVYVGILGRFSPESGSLSKPLLWSLDPSPHWSPSSSSAEVDVLATANRKPISNRNPEQCGSPTPSPSKELALLRRRARRLEGDRRWFRFNEVRARGS
jgi:hypothetical protein